MGLRTLVEAWPREYCVEQYHWYASTFDLEERGFNFREGPKSK